MPPATPEIAWRSEPAPPSPRFGIALEREEAGRVTNRRNQRTHRVRTADPRHREHGVEDVLRADARPCCPATTTTPRAGCTLARRSSSGPRAGMAPEDRTSGPGTW